METSQYKKDLLKQIESLSTDKIKEVLDFIFFIKAKDVIDPAQVYFWTKEWQTMEREADIDKEQGNIIGNGTTKDLLKNLKIT